MIYDLIGKLVNIDQSMVELDVLLNMVENPVERKELLKQEEELKQQEKITLAELTKLREEV